MAAKKTSKDQASDEASKSRTKRSATEEKAFREFISEAEEILERLSSDLADLSDQRASGCEVSPDLVNQLFRSAHSLKGLAGMFGLDALSDLAHHLEDILDGLRLGRISLESPAVALLDDAVRLFLVAITQIDSPAAEESIESDVKQMIARITQETTQAVIEGDELSKLSIDPMLLRALTEYEEHRLRENIRRGRHILLVEATFEILTFDRGLEEVSRIVREFGEVLSTLPSPGTAAESEIRFVLLVGAEIDLQEAKQRLSFQHVSVSEASVSSSAPTHSRAPTEKSAPVAKMPASAPSTPKSAPKSAPTPAPSAASEEGGEAEASNTEMKSLKSISDTVRVDIRKLDELMNLLGELVIQRNALGLVAKKLISNADTVKHGEELLKIHKSVSRKLQDLQSGVLDVRMVPMRQIFEKVSRVVRALKRDMGKEVRLEIKGMDTELDKLIVEELVDPLMHVVRNALDHAIEPAAERVAANKPEEGLIFLEATQRGNHVVIQVRDDGRGIDPDRVRKKAEARGLISSNQTLTQKEILDLIFAPGLSTRDEVTETSGRGVGMDVVRANVTALGGVVDVDSTLGKGTTITMTLPITLAIIQALLVGVADQRYAIPLNSVLETLLVEPSEIQHSEDREILNLRGDALPLRRLAREFNLPDLPSEAKPYAVVLGLGEMKMGLLVERVEGQQDTVIKPIQGPIASIRGIAGATELGDQRAVLVLDVAAIVGDAFRRREVA